MKTKYVLITPAHNEEENIEKVLESVVSQTITPMNWIIVDDGSTDGTGEIVKQYEDRYNFITLFQLKRGDIVTYYSHRTNVVLTGYKQIEKSKFDFLGVLDADISIEPTYYEHILTEFDRNPRLGLASGIYVNKVKGQIREVVRDPDQISTPGALQMFRRECYEGIGGYIPLRYGGDDSLAEIMVRMDGWETKHFPEYQAIQCRATGTSNGTHLLVAIYRGGLSEYILGMHPLFALAKSFRRVFLEKPFLLASMARLSGFLSGYYLVGRNREVADEVVSFVRREQMRRLRTWVFGKLKNAK